MNPGVTVIPSASTIAVSREARLRTSSFEPMATKRPLLTANASARGRESSIVRTRPFTRMRSGRVASMVRPDWARAVEPARPAPAAAAPLRRRNSDRLYLVILNSPGAFLYHARIGDCAEYLVRRPERDRALECRDGGNDLVSLKEKGAELVPRVGVLRVESDGAAESGDGAGTVPEFPRGGREPDFGLQ